MKLCSCPRKQNSKTCILVLRFLLNNLILCKRLILISLTHCLQPGVLLTMIYLKGLARILRKIKVSSPAAEHQEYSNNSYLEKRALKRPQEATVCLELRRQWCSMKHEQPKSTIISFLTTVPCPFQATTYAEYDDKEGKVKTGQPIISIFSQSFLIHQ